VGQLRHIVEHNRPDLDSRERVDEFVDAFYQKVLADAVLAPIFLDVAVIDLDIHLPHIKDYWSKLLLGDKQYQRHTMNIHRQLHDKRPLNQADFQRWLGLFQTTVDEHFRGAKAEQAKRVAATIAANMQHSFKGSDLLKKVDQKQT
jgi:hemoglobin